MTATVTAYCACTLCCGPHATGLNARGKHPVQGVSVAGPRNIPLGTHVRIEGMTNVFTVDDRTARRFDGRFDLFFNSHKDALKFGRRELTVTIVK